MEAPPLLSEFIIAQALCFVKNFLFLGRWWESNPLSPKANVSKGATPSYLSLLIGGSPFYLTAIYTPIVSYFKGVCQEEFFADFSRPFLLGVLLSPFLVSLVGDFLLTIIIISEFSEKSILFQKFLKKYFLDENRLIIFSEKRGQNCPLSKYHIHKIQPLVRKFFRNILFHHQKNF